MKVITFNANGIRSAAKKGFFTWLMQQKADFVCIQETKAQTAQLIPNSLYFPEDYVCEYYDAEKKGYSGVAIYALEKPLNIIKGMNFQTCDSEGRYIQFDYKDYSIISIYLPSGTSGNERQMIKFDFLNRFAQHIAKLLDEGRELIISGDYNIAHKKIDLKNWSSNQKNSGFLPEERAWLDNLFGPMGLIDAFRKINNEPNQYTWWSNRGQAYAKNVGWRIDYQVITQGLVDRLRTVEIYRDIKFSDHAPLVITYE